MCVNMRAETWQAKIKYGHCVCGTVYPLYALYASVCHILRAFAISNLFGQYVIR